MRPSRRRLSRQLYDLQQEIEGYARDAGLDFFKVIYEVLDFEEINMVASYGGFPVRYPHWKWGMEYERMQKSYTYGLHRIYEMVINNDPCYAYLLESNTLVDQKTVIAHVCAHSDFFKHNFTFAHTNRKMMDEMANHATRVRRYIDRLGVEKVEAFVDCCLSIDNLIDIHSPFIQRKAKRSAGDERRRTGEQRLDDDERSRVRSGVQQGPDEKLDLEELRDPQVHRLPNTREYMEGYINPPAYIEEQKQRAREKALEKRRIPSEPERDVMGFLLEHAPLQRWQHDVLDMLREEAYYFSPQGMTKIMNEGWASFWHSRIMTQKALEPSEFVDFADHHSGVMATSGMKLNPYKLGLELFRDIEDRWNRGRFGKEYDECDDLAERRRWDTKTGLGNEKIFQVRKLYNDVTFIDEFLTLDFCRDNKLFSFGYSNKNKRWEIESREFAEIKNRLLDSMTNMGQPVISVVDANHDNRAELLLQHRHEGMDLDPGFASETLKNLCMIWTRPVSILTQIEDRTVMLRFDGEQYSETPVES